MRTQRFKSLHNDHDANSLKAHGIDMDRYRQREVFKANDKKINLDFLSMNC